MWNSVAFIKYNTDENKDIFESGQKSSGDDGISAVDCFFD